MATNNADWFQPSFRPIISPDRLRRSSVTITDVFVAGYSIPFDWNIERPSFPHLARKLTNLPSKEIYVTPIYNLIPVPLPSDFTWYQPSMPPVRHKPILNYLYTSYVSGTTEVNTINYFRRYLNDAGNLNQNIDSE